MERVTPARAAHVNLTQQPEDCTFYQCDRPPFPSKTLGSITSRQKNVFITENPSATYQRDVRESLRKISQLTPCARIVLFRKQSKIVAHIEQPLEQFACFFFPAEQ